MNEPIKPLPPPDYTLSTLEFFQELNARLCKQMGVNIQRLKPFPKPRPMHDNSDEAPGIGDS